ncbi:hypothetical protein Lal_00004229 [Lupinus albus]|nr:hypothetical protein Lal_00004229 [Lupinus albus]
MSSFSSFSLWLVFGGSSFSSSFLHRLFIASSLLPTEFDSSLVHRLFDRNSIDIGRMERCRNENMHGDQEGVCQVLQLKITNSHKFKCDVCVDGPPERQNLKDEANILQQTIVVEYSQHDSFQGKFLEQQVELEDKYQKLYEPLYTMANDDASMTDTPLGARGSFRVNNIYDICYVFCC